MTLKQFPWWLWGHVAAKRWERLMNRLSWSSAWHRFTESLWPKQKALIKCPIRHFLVNLCRSSRGCPHCRYEDFIEHEDLFTVTDSGCSQTQDGDSYWWEGWQQCFRCGVKSWVHDST